MNCPTSAARFEGFEAHSYVTEEVAAAGDASLALDPLYDGV